MKASKIEKKAMEQANERVCAIAFFNSRERRTDVSFTINEVAKMLRVSRESLRNWESQGVIPKPKRRPTNQREYTDADIEAIKNYLNKRK